MGAFHTRLSPSLRFVPCKVQTEVKNKFCTRIECARLAVNALGIGVSEYLF